MLIKKGTYRSVVLIPRFNLAIKFPIIRVKMFFQTLVYSVKNDFYFWITCDVNTYHGAKWYFKGISENWLEYRFYRRNKSNNFLQPIHFSLFGLFAIVPLTEECPADQFRKLYVHMYRITDCDVSKDGHHFGENENFCLYKGRICMRDYGDTRTQEIITKHMAKLNELTIQ